MNFHFKGSSVYSFRETETLEHSANEMRPRSAWQCRAMGPHDIQLGFCLDKGRVWWAVVTQRPDQVLSPGTLIFCPPPGHKNLRPPVAALLHPCTLPPPTPVNLNQPGQIVKCRDLRMQCNLYPIVRGTTRVTPAILRGLLDNTWRCSVENILPKEHKTENIQLNPLVVLAMHRGVCERSFILALV